MGWKARNERQQEALWRVFLMFVFMALLIIRTGEVSRGITAVVFPDNAQQDAALAAKDQPLPASPTDLYQATLVLLSLAEAVGRLFILSERAVWELMNRLPPLPVQEPSSNVASLCERPAQRLDSS